MNPISLEFATRILVPKCDSKVLHRQRLVDLLLENINLSCQVVSAPTGYGKTTLLVDLANDLEVPVCWFSMDTTCQDPKILLDGIVACLQINFPDFGKQTALVTPSTHGEDKGISRLVRAITGAIYTQIADYFVLILDDFHSIEDSSQSKMLINCFIEHIPENCHLIISSRSSFELPVLSSLLVRQRVIYITASHLSFTSEEVRELLAAHYKTDLSAEQSDKMVAATEGWILGILLSTQNLIRNLPDPGIPKLSKQSVFRFLTREVFDKQPAIIQDFLLESSTLDEIEPESCKALLGISDCKERFRYIEERNLFLHCINADKEWYRYSSFFREFLQDKLFREYPDRYAFLHRKVGMLCKQSKQWNRAINHLIKAQEFSEVKEIIKIVGEDYQDSGKWSIIVDWINALAMDIPQMDSQLVLLYSKSLIHLGQVDKAIKYLSQLVQLLSIKGDHINQAQALSWRSAAFRLSGLISEAKNDIQAAISLLKKNNGPDEDLGEAHRRLGDIYKETGQFKKSITHMKRALNYFSSIFDVGSLAQTHNSMGVIYKRLGDYLRAETHFEQARQGWQKINNIGALAATLNNIGNIYQHWGQHELALDTFRLGLEKSRAAGYVRMEASLLINIAEAYRGMNKYSEALTTYHQGLDLARQVMETYYVIWAKAGIGETYQLVAEYDKAIIYLKEAIALAKESGQVYEEALFSMKLGIVEYSRGNYQAAIKILIEVFDEITRLGDKDTLARTCLHLAQASFLARQYDKAINWLNKSSLIANELKYDDFFVTEGRKAILLLQYGISHDVDPVRFSRIIEKIKERYENNRGRVVVEPLLESNIKSEPQIKAYAFGESHVELDRIPVSDSDWRSNRAKEIFFYLLYCKDGRTKEQIATTFWPDLSPAKSTSNFHINLYRARRAVYPGIFVLEHGRYKLNPLINVWFDVAEFKNLVEEAEKVPRYSKTWSDCLQQAIELYKGSYMPNFYSEWIETERRELENKYLKILPSLARFRGERKDYSAAIALLEKFIAVDPYHEEVYCQLIEWYLAEQDKISALRAYKQYLDIATTDLEIKPSARLDEVYREILKY